ncbi:ABC transporter permease [Mycolicibacterium sp. YH-1]|uniref:ABC transporter permease n=1 Tax=Mycolicibacterium sp. YH-1 TaxID=2908837 RepID=UPI001F4C30D0|nr:ABC transporter permease [Mycolicibacterium sp. YH-1]UNB52927.1 ABC transporter permease [Mycolicibacterium sp. YH-1]
MSELVWPRLRNTLILGLVTAAVTFPLAILVGSWAGARAGSRGDRISSTLGLVFMTLPEFAAGTLLVYLFGVRLRLLPVVSAFDPDIGPLSEPATLVLPALSLALISFGFAMRYVRSSVAESMRSDCVRMARLNGFPERQVLFRYGLRNALAPIIQVSSLTFLGLLAGVVVTETVFSYPGLGALIVTTSLNRDFTTLVAASTVIAALYAIMNIANDVALLYANPRLRKTTR